MSPAFSLSRRLAASCAVLLSVFASACGPSQPARAAEHPIVRMAIFDLNCPREQLEYVQIDAGMWGVSGCGRRTKYVRVCRQVGVGYFVSDDCHWVQN